MECGIVGPRLSGKSTLFSILTGVENPVDSGKRETQRGVATLTDHRLNKLAEVWQSKKIVNATVEYVDIPGLTSKKDAPGGYPPQYLADLRGADMLALVVRDFENDLAPTLSGRIDPESDLLDAALEFTISDLEVVEKRLARVSRQTDKDSKIETVLMQRLADALSAGKPLRDIEMTTDDLKIIKGYSFLSLKPLLVVLNVGEDRAQQAGERQENLKRKVTSLGQGVEWVVIAGGIEAEIAQLDEEERAPFMEELGFELPALDRIIKSTFRLMGLSTFLTAGPKESRAWTIHAGSNAQAAARVIHEDIARGFIRAEVYCWEDLIRAGSEAQLKKEGKLRLEGKEYIVQDGDVLNVRFNV